MHKGFACTFLLIFTASQAFAIFEEQAGENDWHAEFVGRLTDAQPCGKDNLIISTASNVLAKVSLTSGSIVWRQVLHQSDQLQAFTVLSKPAAVVSLSNSSSLLRSWRLDDGALLWEKHMQPSAHSLSATLSIIPEMSLGAGESIALAAAGRIQVQQLALLEIALTRKNQCQCRPVLRCHAVRHVHKDLCCNCPMLQQVFSGLKGSLLWQADSKSLWEQASSTVVIESNADDAHAVAVAGLTDRQDNIVQFRESHTTTF